MNQNPWREVEHINIEEGPKGGRYYFLRLSCGHFKSVAIRNRIRDNILLARNLNPQVAPHKCRCHFCSSSDSN